MRKASNCVKKKCAFNVKAATKSILIHIKSRDQWEETGSFLKGGLRASCKGVSRREAKGKGRDLSTQTLGCNIRAS